MDKIQSDREKVEALYELTKELTRSEVYLISSNARRIMAIVRLLLAELTPDRVIEHPLDFE